MRLGFLRLDDYELYDGERVSILEPLGLAYIMAYVGEEHEMVGWDLNAGEEFKDYDDIDFLFITLPTVLYSQCKKIIKKFKTTNPEGIVVVGGPHPSANPIECYQNLGADFVVMGEGEVAINTILNEFKELLKDPKSPILSGSSFYAISLLFNLDDIRLPNRYVFDANKYKLHLGDGKNQKVASVITSRSCPYACTYCASRKIFGNQFRMRSVDNVMDELYVLKETGYNTVIFLDDTFTFRKKRVIALCNKMIREEINMAWWVDTRVDKVDSEILEAMKAAGCQMIVYGIESGNQKILDRIKKNITLEQAEKAIKLTKEVGIECKANFMLGHLGEDRDQILETINFAKKIQADRTSFYINLPLPGTAQWDFIKEDIGPDSYDRMKWYGNDVPSICDLESKELKDLQKKAYEEMK